MIGRVAILIVGLCGVARAEPTDVTADRAVALYREHNPRLTALRAELDVTATDLVDAHVYPNPSLGLTRAQTIAGTDTIGSSQYAFALEIPILIGHQRSRREAVARARIEATRRRIDASAATAELEIRALFAALQAAQERTATLAAAVDDARNLRVIVAGRSAAGASSSYAVERIDLAIAALASRRDEAEADLGAASADLAGAVGVAGWAPRAIGVLEPGTAVPIATVDSGHPRLAVDHQAEIVAHAEHASARSAAIPTPSVGLQSFATTGPTGAAITIGVSIPMPIFDRNQGAIARARAEASRAALEHAADASELDADLEAARHLYLARHDALSRFRTDALQHLTRLREMAESAYRNGQGGIVELLDALDAITEAQLRDIDLRAAVVRAELAIRTAAKGR